MGAADQAQTVMGCRSAQEVCRSAHLRAFIYVVGVCLTAVMVAVGFAMTTIAAQSEQRVLIDRNREDIRAINGKLDVILDAVRKQ